MNTSVQVEGCLPRAAAAEISVRRSPLVNFWNATAELNGGENRLIFTTAAMYLSQAMLWATRREPAWERELPD